MASPDLNITSLRLFADVVVTGSFTAAAARHDMSQPAVSFHIRQLETRFDVPLLERLGRRAVPTPAGAELLRHAHAIVAAADATTISMAAFRPNRLGVVRIGAVTTACVAVVPRILRQVRAAMPELELVVTTGLSPEIVEAVQAERLDIGIVTLPETGRSEMILASPGYADEIVLLAHTDAGFPVAVTSTDLRDRPPMLLQATGATRALIDAWFAATAVPFHPSLVMGSVEAIVELVEMRIGNAMLSRMALANRSLPDAVVIHRLAPPIRRTMGRVIRRDRVHDVSLNLVATMIDREMTAAALDRATERST